MNTLIKKNKSQSNTTRKFQILTRHPSYNQLRTLLPEFPFKVIARFGSVTEIQNTIVKGGKTIEINKIAAVKNSASKLLMKKCFHENNVKTADWWIFKENNFYQVAGEAITQKEELPYPLIIKSYTGSRGIGNYYIENQVELDRFISNHNMDNYLIEKYMMGMRREYRLHINALEGICFYTCRKLLKSDTPKEESFQKHSDTCVWILQENPKFDCPPNWNEIVEECVKAIRSVGLDIGAVDVIMQTSINKETGKKRENPSYKLCETSSAPSMAEITTQKYQIELPKIAFRLAKEANII